MEILVRREKGTKKSTPGKMYVDGKMFAYTMEDVERLGVAVDKSKKVYGRTAIPRGKYKAIVNYSPHFKREVTLLLDVPQFKGIRIHSGNTAADSEGCILVAKNRKNKDKIWGDSRKLESKLTNMVKKAQASKEKVYISIAGVEDGELLVLDEVAV